MKRKTYFNLAGYVTSYDFEGDSELENLINTGIITPKESRRVKMSVNYLQEAESLTMDELSRIIRKTQPLLTLAKNSDEKNSEWQKQLENLRSAAQKLQALISESEVQTVVSPGSRSITMIETTLRRIIYDYVYKRPQFKTKMKWQSEFSKDKIVVHLEEKPFSQESLDYRLMDEAEHGTKK